jgi:hypothetical protein
MNHPSEMLAPDRRWYRNPDVIASSLLVVLGVLFFADVLFTSKNFYFRDILNFHYPLRKVLIDSYARGEWPLWNPYVYLGQPMLANPNYMAFYPSNLFHLFLPFNYAFKLHFVIHPILASLGVYFLQRRLSLPPIACFGGAVVYAFSGIVLSFLNLYNFVPSVALLPWIGWALLNALDRRTSGSVLLFGLLLAFQILSFDLFIALCDLLLLLALALVYVLQSADKVRDTLRILRIGLLGGLFAVCLAAIQILPTLELVPLSVRGTGFKFGTVTLWSLHPMDLLNMIVPNLFGYPFTLSKRLYWGEAYHFGREGYLVSFFVGIGSILMVLLSFWSVRRRARVVFLALGSLSVFLALGRSNPWWAWLYSYVPVFRTGRYPVKLVLILAIAISLLTALGLEVLLTRFRDRSGWRRAIPVVAVALIGVIVGLAALSVSLYCEWNPRQLIDFAGPRVLPELRRAKDFPGIARQLVASLRACGTYAIIMSAILIVSLRLKRPALGGLLVMLALCAESMPQNLRLAPMISEADMDYVSAVNGQLGKLAKDSTSRVLAMEGDPRHLRYHLRAPNDSVAWNTLFFRNAGLPFYGIMEGIQYSLYIPVDGLSTSESNVLFDLFMARGAFRQPEVLQRTNTLHIATLDRLDNPAARIEGEYATGSDLNLTLYRLEDALERAYFVSGVRRAKSSAEALSNLLDPSFPIRDAVILEDPRVADSTGRCQAGAVKMLRYEAQEVLCETSAEEAGYLVLLDSYYPGWICSVDGRQVPIMRANYCFRGVEVPAGKHSVEFRYRPQGFYAGLIVTILSLLAGVAVVLYSAGRGAS